MLTIYKASAGSGKTYTLAYEYIRALLGVKAPGTTQYRLNHPAYSPKGAELTNRHRYILAITFTNKATEEMKRRIINELDSLTVIPGPGEDDAEYAPRLCRELGCSREHLAEVASTALRQLLYDYHSFHVTTIDSFFQRVLRTFARELDRQGDFNIELNDKLAVQQSVDNMLDDFNLGVSSTPPAKGAVQLGDWIYHFMSRQIDEGRKSNFFNRRSALHSSLVGLVATICEERFRPYSSRMREYLSDGSRLRDFAKALDQRRGAIMADLRRMSEDVIKALNADGGVYDALKPADKLRAVMERFLLAGELPEKKEIIGGTYQKLITGEWNRYGQRPFKDHVGAIATAMDFAQKAQIKMCNCYMLDLIRDSLSLLGLLAHAWPYLDSFVSENNTVLLSDTSHLLSRIIGGDETPFVYERMGVQLHHFLIDEFQDTSHMQWDNLRPLVANSMGEGFDNLIIGDEKQSIYSFRNSDPELLHNIVATRDFPVPRFDTRIRGNAEGENTNYRSASDVVRFNNTLFTVLARMIGIGGYDNVVQNISQRHTDHRGYVHFIPGDEPDEALGVMAETMRGQVARGFGWGDITVILRTNAECAKVVEYLLTECPDIPVLSDEALYLKKSAAVQKVLSLLRLIEQSTLTSTREPGKSYISATKADVSVFISRFEYFRSKGLGAPEAVTCALRPAGQADEDDTLIASIDTIRGRKPSTIVSLIETIIHEQLAGETADQVAYLTAFQDFAIDYCSRYNPTLTALLAAWEIQKDKLCIPMSADVRAVRVMTVHKSKGLEFPCVHIPYASWAVGYKSSSQWREVPHIDGIPQDIVPPVVSVPLGAVNSVPGVLYHDDYEAEVHADLAEMLNVLYVAYTRAGEELTVYYNPGKELGALLTDAFKQGCPDASNPLLCNLDSPVAGTEGEYAWGVQVVKGKPGGEVGAEPCAEAGRRRLDDYRVFFHDEADVLTRVTDMLELDNDAAEDDEDLPDTTADVYADDSARDRGVILHDALSLIDKAGDIAAAVHITARAHHLGDDDAGHLAGILRDMLLGGDARVQRWFADDADTSNEQSLYSPRSARMRRPDRMVFYPDGSVDVVDYKFTSEMSPKHVEQVREYTALLREAGYEKIYGYLWYPLLDKPTIKEVSAK